MLSYTDLKKGVLFVLDGQPYEVLESSFLRMQQRKAVVQTKIRNLVSGKILDRNWQASDEFEEAEVERKEALFIYKKSVRGEGGDEYWFHEAGNPPKSPEAIGARAEGSRAKKRFALSGEVIGESAQFLKPNTKVETTIFNEKIIKIQLPIKMDFEVVEAPPGIKGNTAQGGTKTVVIEGGANVQAPLFINQGDIIRINTTTGEYVERVEKGS